ncbi:MAG: glycosyltransferase family 4 protein, partial [Candidatus Omnitrophica bacterium]|nr:glycosyltransferase family 4 protein [Candidatus Omnitrophota bacterium]
ALRSLFYMRSAKREELFFLRLPPLPLGIVGMAAKKLYRCKVLVNVQDIYPDFAIEAGILKNRLLIRLAKALERRIYDAADHIIVISEDFKRNLSGKGVKDEKITVISNWVDTDTIQPLKKNNLLASRMGLNDKFVVMYAGSITFTNQKTLSGLLKVAERLREMRDIIFVFMGEGLKKKMLQEEAASLGLANLQFFPFVAYADLSQALAASDILVVPQDDAQKEFSVPSKCYTFMAAGRPLLVLGESSSEVSNMVRDADAGICLSPIQDDTIAAALVKFKDTPEKCRQWGENARRYALAHFSREKVLRQYQECIAALSR